MSIPYGKPIANNFFYILDDNLNPVPKGIVGELYIGGVGVAVGYANDKAKTDAAFVKDPFNKKLGGRMYRTGDLGRMDSNNNMEFIGRKDHQTKIRGFRVELGEIEHQLQKHELVKDAIVTVKKDTADSNFLCAYIVADEPVMANEYRQYLSDHLPEYMIPAHFISLESIPLTSNGKINRKALPDPEITIKHSTAYVAPENEIEEKLSLIWQRILRLEKLSVTDSIIEMGAHSLNIGSFVNTVRRDLNIEISIRDVFTNPTIRDLCQLIGGKEMAEEVIINPVPEADHFPTTHAQKRLWFLNQFDENLAAYNMPGAYMIEGEFDKVILEKAFRTLVERHESLRTKFDQVDGELVQVIDNSDDKKFALQYLDISQEEYKEELAKNYASGEASKLFDLTNGPLFRIKLIHLDDNKNLFLFTMHHIISDGWSKGVLLDEIMHLYNAFDNNQPNPLEPLAIQYKDYAVWQNEQLSKTALSEHRNYWLNQFEGTIPEIELPTDFDRPQVKSYKGDEVSMPIDGEILEFLNDFSKSNGGSLFMTLLTSVNALLHKFTGQEDIVVGSPVAGRDIDGLENQIGLYLNTLALRSKFDKNDSFLELFERVKNNMLGALEHQVYPFDLLVNDLKLERKKGRLPLFDVWVVLQNMNDRESQVPETSVSDFNVKRFGNDFGVSRYDLRFTFKEYSKGLLASINFSTDLFKKETIENLLELFKALLTEVKVSHHKAIKDLCNQSQNTKTDHPNGGVKLVRRERKRKTSSELVHGGGLEENKNLPYLYEAQRNNVNLQSWLEQNRKQVNDKLQNSGAILFRGFDVNNIVDFQNVVEAHSDQLLTYDYASTPRTAIESKVYTSTEYPSDQEIGMHNEMSYTKKYPNNLWFFCKTPAQVGGETPLVDSKAVYDELDDDIKVKFQESGLLYIRNYHSKLDLSWQKAFQTDDKAVVEKYCQDNDLEFEWISKDHLRTKEKCLSCLTHDKNESTVWFNQAHLFHASSVDPDLLQHIIQMVGEEGLPRNVFFGDGSAIPADMIHKIKQVYDQHKILFSWQKGDVLLIDNVLVAHGRQPFEGQREILVSMSN